VVDGDDDDDDSQSLFFDLDAMRLLAEDMI
jgi:hypothetical protein